MAEWKGKGSRVGMTLGGSIGPIRVCATTGGSGRAIRVWIWGLDELAGDLASDEAEAGDGGGPRLGGPA